MTNPNSKTILAGELLDLSSANQVITKIYVDCVIGNYCARTKGNSAGDVRDTAVTGIYVGNDASCISTLPIINTGAWDKVFNHSTGANLRCVVETI